LPPQPEWTTSNRPLSDDTLANLTGNWPTTGLLEWELANYAEKRQQEPCSAYAHPI
jgi:hypothetical protein